MPVSFHNEIDNTLDVRGTLKALQGEAVYLPLWAFCKFPTYVGSIYGKDQKLGASNCLRVSTMNEWSLGSKVSSSTSGVNIVMPACKGFIGDISEKNNIEGELTSLTLNFDAINHYEQPETYPGPILKWHPCIRFRYSLLGSESANEHRKPVVQYYKLT